jgi:hypothetical protein
VSGGIDHLVLSGPLVLAVPVALAVTTGSTARGPFLAFVYGLGIGIPWSVAMTWLKIHWIPGYQLPL